MLFLHVVIIYRLNNKQILTSTNDYQLCPKYQLTHEHYVKYK